MDHTTQVQPLDPRRREAHPERITIANETFERNDVRAKNLHMSERSLNRGDRLGAPFIFLGGVKYRPVERHDAFILASIKRASRPHRKGSRPRDALPHQPQKKEKPGEMCSRPGRR
jgi:hypothetical protein